MNEHSLLKALSQDSAVNMIRGWKALQEETEKQEKKRAKLEKRPTSKSYWWMV